MSTHENHMRHALSLANRALGHVAPNPAVGCVVVKNDIVIGRGWTQDGGRPHAETEALKKAGNNAKGATVYVTLEPCSHHGQTPPCAEAIIKAKVTHVVIACIDPNPKVSGKGIVMLKDAGIDVTKNVCEKEAQALNAGFFLSLGQNRPFVTLKLATSKDYKIAVQGERTQISGPVAQRYTHLLRSKHDAIMVGANTARIDNPKLTTRINGYEHFIKRIILDAETFADPYNLKPVLAQIAEEGITRLLIEGGAKVMSSFLESGLYDEFQWLKAPITIGDRGVEALHNHNISNISANFGLELQKTRHLGEDLLEIYRPKA
ncbi:MAG: bifunctional diaminohydroxyphosphoribosylaminopyrimidine deaminase/5-amino-6-(5-phosphoribosylamino)uracil reductase RibD [Pseudomonadota bacterium]